MTSIAHHAMLIAGASVASTGPLLHFDGANGSTSIIDAHGGSTWSVSGSAQLSTAQQKFGPSSLLPNGGYISTANAGAIKSGDFCVEGWGYATGTPRGVFHDFPNSSATGLALGRNGSVWEIYHNGSVTQSASLTVPTGWFHWAVYRVGSTLVATIDGVVIISVSDSGTFGAFQSMYVGTYYNNGFPWVGYIDEFRMTLGSSPYPTIGFTPPTSPFI